MKEREQGLEEPEDQESFGEIVSSGNDREATPMKFQQWDLVSDSVQVDVPGCIREVSRNPKSRDEERK